MVDVLGAVIFVAIVAVTAYVVWRVSRGDNAQQVVEHAKDDFQTVEQKVKDRLEK